MKKTSLNGFGVVYRQNLRIHMKSAKYLISTILVGLVLILGMGALVFFVSKSEADEDDYDYNASKVYVVDETGLGAPDYSLMAVMLGYDYAMDTKFIISDKPAKELIHEDGVEYMIVQTKQEDDYVLQIVSGESIDEESGQIDKNLECLEEIACACFQSHLYSISGLDTDQILQALLPVKSEVSVIGDEADDDGKYIVAFVGMFASVMLVYFMVLIYGTQICADVPIEKTSKLVEQLLMSVSPYALVSGKILSMITSCIIQFLIWVACLIVGILGGDALVRSICNVDKSVASEVMDNIKLWYDGAGFDVPSIIIAVLLLIAGLVLYLLLAGLGGAMLSKPEDAGNVQSVFILPLIVSFFSILWGSGFLEGNYEISIVYNMIPFTAAMTAPASTLLGYLSLPMACVSLLVSLMLCMVVLYVAAKVYEGFLFFGGNKLKLKDIINVFKE